MRKCWTPYALYAGNVLLTTVPGRPAADREAKKLSKDGKRVSVRTTMNLRGNYTCLDLSIFENGKCLQKHTTKQAISNIQVKRETDPT